MNSSFKFNRIVIYDNKNVFYASLPLDGSITVDHINKILDFISQLIPSTFYVRLE